MEGIPQPGFKSSHQRLALGKFEPKDRTSFDPAYSALELDLDSYFRWDLKDRNRFRTWIKKRRIGVICRIRLRGMQNGEIFSEWFENAREEFQGQQLWFSIASGRKLFDPLEHQVSLETLARTTQDQKMEILFEWGESDSIKSTRFLTELIPYAGFVLDPDIHGPAMAKWRGPVHFKLHGWHPERWIRRYGSVFGARIAARLKSHSDSILILSHSGRFEEGPLFSKLLSELKL